MKSSFFRMLFKRVITIVVSVHAIILSIFSAVLLIGILSAVTLRADSSDTLDYRIVEGNKGSANKILSIPVTGVILGDVSESPSSLPFLTEGVTFGYRVKDELLKASKDSDIKGVVLEVNSPGGTIYGSRAIADGIADYKKATGNPVYVYIGGLAASGGYMASVTADQIFADYGSTIGSIGVIYGPIKFYDTVISEGGLLEGEVLTQNGIESTYISAGKSKDLGNPYRQITTEEKASLQKMVDTEYTSFVNLVSTQRKIPQEQIRNTIGALIYANDIAKELHLIDGTHNKQDTYTILAKNKRLSDYQVIQKAPSYGFFENLLLSTGFTKKSLSTCLIPETILVYHGDLSVLCSRNN